MCRRHEEIAMKTFKETCDFTGLDFKFEISDAALTSIGSCKGVEFKVKTDAGTRDFFEWTTEEDGKLLVERTDSNIRINQLEEVIELFPDLKLLNCPADDSAPIEIIFDAIEQIINK